MHCKSLTLIYYQYKNGMYAQWHDFQLKQDLEMCEFSALHTDKSISVCDKDSSLLGNITIRNWNFTMMSVMFPSYLFLFGLQC